MDTKHHPILEKPWEYRIVSFHYDCSSLDPREHSLEMVLQKEKTLKKLLFTGPRQLTIEAGFPSPTHGMQILDIHEQGLEDMNVLVTDFEATPGAIHFSAKEVTEIK